MTLNSVELSKIVNCDADLADVPACVKSIISNAAGGQVDCTTLQIFLTPEQEARQIVSCAVAVEAAADKSPANMAMLMHLFRNQDRIPEGWKQYTTVGFSGTEVENGQGERCILVLGYSGKWYIGVRKLDYASSAKKPLVLAPRL